MCVSWWQNSHHMGALRGCALCGTAPAIRLLLGFASAQNYQGRWNHDCWKEVCLSGGVDSEHPSYAEMVCLLLRMVPYGSLSPITNAVNIFAWNIYLPQFQISFFYVFLYVWRSRIPYSGLRQGGVAKVYCYSLPWFRKRIDKGKCNCNDGFKGDIGWSAAS